MKIVQLTCFLFFAFLLVEVPLVSASAARPDVAEVEAAVEGGISGNEEDLAEEMEPDDGASAKEAETHVTAAGFTGYRFLSTDNYGGRAAKYDYLHSGVIGGALYNWMGQDLKLAIDGKYLNDNDYNGDLAFDYAGKYRFLFKTQSVFHNLTGDKLFSQTLPIWGVNYIPYQQDSLTGYGLRTQQDSAAVRYRLYNLPLHLNLSYMHIAAEGTKQLRFADVDFRGGENNFFARSSVVDRQTHEGSIGFDAHLGPIDLIYMFQIRQFVNQANPSADPFTARSAFGDSAGTLGGIRQHNVEPDSRYMAHTAKAHTSLEGGIVAAASYTYGERDNLATLAESRTSGETSVKLHNVAGDLVYTPIKEITFGVKYRRQEINNNSPSTITDTFFPESMKVRPSISTEKDIITGTFLYRPLNQVTVKGEYKGEFLHRDLVHFNDLSLNWDLPANQNTQKGTISVLARPVKGLRLNARYAFSSTDNPSYGTSSGEKHEGELAANYSISSKLGLTANYTARRESNDKIETREISAAVPAGGAPFLPLLSRDKGNHNFTSSLWFVPFQRVTVTATFGFLKDDIDQAVMFSAEGAESMAASNYKAISHLYSLSSTYQFSEKLDFSLALQEIHSTAEFRPQNRTFANGDNTTGLTELAHSKTTETSFSARAGYRFTRYLASSLEYMLQDFYDKFNPTFDGTVHTVIAAVTAKW